MSMVRTLLSLSVFLCTTILAYGQTLPFHYDSGYTWRAYTGTVTPPICPNRLCHYYQTSETAGWSPSYTEFTMWRSQTDNPNSVVDFLNFRVMFPKGYNKSDNTKKWPVILFLHGAGEGGRKWSGVFDYAVTDPLIDNNSRVLIHGGNEHKVAVKDKAYTDPKSYPGIVVFPQVSYNGSWSDGWNGGALSTNQEYTIAFIEYILSNYNGDINKVAVHGLSNGGKATWDFATKRPDLFSAAQPFSGVPYDNNLAAQLLYTMPIKEYQGGVDTNPNPNAAQDAIDAINAAGGSAQLIIYPTLGHGTWQTAMAQPDFFSWILQQDKRKIYVVGGSNSLCNTPTATKKLAFSAGFKKYWWHKVVSGVDVPIDTIAVPTAVTRALTVGAQDPNTGFGTYKLKFMRKDNIWYDSYTQDVVTQGAAFVPPVTSTGSWILPYTRDNGAIVGSIGQTKVTLVAPTGLAQYQWYKDGVLVTNTGAFSGATSNTLSINTSTLTSANYTTYTGTYTLLVKDASGCQSDPSAGKVLSYDPNTATTAGSYGTNTTGSWHTSPTGTSNGNDFTGIGTPVYTLIGDNSVKLTWTDNVSDEEYFEVWRYRRSGSVPDYPAQNNYVVVATVPAGTTTYTDKTGLRPGAEYAYRVRAIKGNQGRFSAEPNVKIKLPTDTQSPSTPTDLKVTSVGLNTVGISWTPATDNDVIWRYEVFVNGASNALLFNDVNTTTDKDQTDGNPAPPTSYTIPALDPASTYVISIRAIDFIGNKSSFAESVTATTKMTIAGVNYKYYKVTSITGSAGHQLDEPRTNNFNFATVNPTKTGVVSYFDISGANTFQNTTDPNLFYFAFDAQVQILTAGNYRFWTSSDDGSRLYIDGALVVNNDGDHGTANISGVVNNMAVGYHTIRVTFYENGGGQVLDVRWQSAASGTPPNNFNTATQIPQSQLISGGTPVIAYYSNSSGNLESLASWGKNADGSGTAPVSFTAANQSFTIANRPSGVTLTAPWTVSGASSKVIVGSNVSLTLNEALTAKVLANANSTITLNHATLPTLLQLDSTSTVNMNVSGTVPNAVYGNLNLKTAASAKVLPVGSTVVKGALTVDDQVSLKGTTPNQSAISVTGNVAFNGNSGATVLADGETYALALKGNVPHTIAIGANDLKLYGLTVDFGSTLNIDFGGATSGRTINIGATGGSQGLLLRTGSTFNLLGHSLIVKGVYGLTPTEDSGAINSTSGNITLDIASASSSNLSFTSGSTLTNLSFTNARTGQLNINTPAVLNNLATFNSTTNVFNNFIVKSDATGTARIAPIPSTAKVNGDITVQRFMEGEGQIYRYISSPVKGLRVVDLQQYFPITGDFTGASVIEGMSSAASMFDYVEPTPGYRQFPQTTNLDTLRNGVGYSAFIREAVNPTTWQGKGTIHQGNVSYTLVPDPNATNSNDGWNLVGNPYPAPIKWTGNNTGGWTISGVNQVVSVRENWAGGYQYKTYSLATGGSPDAHGGPNYDGVITVGQAFWVQSINTTPSLTSTEAAKQTSDGAFYREGAPFNTMNIRMKSPTLVDGTFIHFDGSATDAYDRTFDGVKLANSYFNISTLSSDNVSLAINQTSGNTCVQDIRMRITNADAGSYSLLIGGKESIISGDQVVLMDAYTNTQTALTGDLTYPFNITTDAASKADGRFVLRFIKPSIDFAKTLDSQAGCDDNGPQVLVAQSQPGVGYRVFMNGTAVSDVFVGNGGQLALTVDPSKVPFGKTNVSIQAGFGQCNLGTLQQTVNVTKDALLTTPTISMNSGILTATQVNAPNMTYQWFFEGQSVPGATSSQLAPQSEGNYTVQTISGGCAKTSDVFFRQPLYTNARLTSTNVCNDNAVVSLDASQENVVYTAYYNGTAVSSQVNGTGDTMTISLNSSLIGAGEKQISIKANVINDLPKFLDQKVTISRSVLGTPQVVASNGILTSSVEDAASYRWFLNGTEISGEVSKSIQPPVSGAYSVEATSGSCTTLSAPVSYAVTGLGDDPAFLAAYPNPARDKVVVTTGIALSTHMVKFQTILGQTMTVPMTKLSDKSIELDIAQMSAGLYLLHVNGKTLRIAKE